MILEEFYKMTREELNNIEKNLKDQFTDNNGMSGISLEVIEISIGEKRGEILMTGYFWR